MMSLKLKKYQLLLLAVLSGVLMSLSWFPYGYAPVMFIAWIPLLIVDKYIGDNPSFFSRGSSVLYSYVTFIIWNVVDTWWVAMSTVPGGIAAFMLNALFMSLVFGLFHVVRTKVFKSYNGYFTLIFFWIAYEYLHLDWDLSWSWLVLGNVFAPTYTWVQWYEFTGVFGGSLWVLLVNILIFIAFAKYSEYKNQIAHKILLTSIALILFPIVISLVQYYSYEEKGEKAEVVVIQPNVDPYFAEFNTPPEDMVHNLLDLSRQAVSPKTELIVCPESSIQEYMWENQLFEYLSCDSIQTFLSENPKVNFLTGSSTRRILSENEEPKPFARKYPFDTTKSYYVHNTAMFFSSISGVELYHKSRLVPGVEKMPFSSVMKHFEKFAIDLGGMSGSYGIDSVPNVFRSGNTKIVAAPIICYESIYGEFVGGFIKKGANLICIITNDGWWGNTPGYRQHYMYARLRAIETRRFIARSANTGISGFFNQRGDDFQAQTWWKRSSIKQDVSLNNELTFYTKHGDFIARISLIMSAILIIIGIVVWFRKKAE